MAYSRIKGITVEIGGDTTKHIIMGIVNGIRSCISAVGDAVNSVAQKIRSVLHFSVPDEGPLVDYESWMPDFMAGLAKGIEQSRSLVQKAIGNTAADMVISPKLAAVSGSSGGAYTDGDSSALASGIGTAVADALKNFSGQTGDIVIPVYVDGKFYAEGVLSRGFHC